MDSWAWDSKKPREKPNKPKKTKILNGLTQDSSHRIVFFGFSRGFWTLVFLEFLDSWVWGSKNLEKNQINQTKTKKNQSRMDLPKILLTGLFFLFFWFSLSFWTVGAWDSKNFEKNQINKKKQKNNPEWTYPRFFSQDWFFCFFFGFSSSFWTVGFGTAKTSRKTRKPKKQKKTIWNRLTPDSSHRIVFFVSFWFSLTFWIYGKVEMKKGKKHEKTKDAKIQSSQRPFLFF